MKCPRCNVTLLLSEKQGVEIDYCPDCRGIWLDRGELEKIVERSYESNIEQDYNYRENNFKYEDDHHNKDYKYDHHQSYGDNRFKKKKSFLGEIFDF